jgi:hypothetical protein
MLWFVLVLLLSALGVLWWRFAMPASAGPTMAPPRLEGNHPSLRTRHYRLADFYPAPPVVLPGGPPASEERKEAAQPGQAIPDSDLPEANSVDDRATLEGAGRLPEGALHNYLAAPAPTATDAHNRRVELTAAERRAKMRSVMAAALENRRAAPA